MMVATDKKYFFWCVKLKRRGPQVNDLQEKTHGRSG